MLWLLKHLKTSILSKLFSALLFSQADFNSAYIVLFSLCFEIIDFWHKPLDLFTGLFVRLNIICWCSLFSLLLFDLHDRDFWKVPWLECFCFDSCWLRRFLCRWMRNALVILPGNKKRWEWFLKTIYIYSLVTRADLVKIENLHTNFKAIICREQSETSIAGPISLFRFKLKSYYIDSYV